MTQPNQAVFSDVEEEARWKKASPCDGSVCPTVGGVESHLVTHAIALRTADRVEALGDAS